MTASADSSNDKSADVEEFPLAPAEGLSPQERIFRSRHYPEVSEPEPVQKSPQFTIRQLMLLTFIVALGLAGGSWIPPQSSAGIVGFVLMLGMLIRIFITAESNHLNWCLGALGIAYGAALLRVLCS